MTNREYLNTLNTKDFAQKVSNLIFKFFEIEFRSNPEMYFSEMEYNATIEFKIWLDKKHKE